MKKLPPEAYGDCEGAICKMSSPYAIFLAVYTGSNGFPCNGCGYYQGGACPAFKFLHQGDKPENMKAPDQKPEETVSQMAARLGISKSEVRRRRASATPAPQAPAEKISLGTLLRDKLLAVDKAIKEEEQK